MKLERGRRTDALSRVRIRVENGLELRSLELIHAFELHRLTLDNLKHLQEWLPWAHEGITLNDTQDFIAGSLEQLSGGSGFQAGIWHREKLIGMIGFHRIDWTNFSVSIGYWISREYQGRGLMRKSCLAMLEYGFTRLGLNRIEIRCASENWRSRTIPESIGFVQEGILREVERLNHRFVDHVIYAMLASQWRGRNEGG